MKHLNNNILCVVDTETTGLIAGHHDIIEVCVLPLNSMLEPDPNIIPFHADLRPKRPENIDLAALKIQPRHYVIDMDDVAQNKDKIIDATLKGLDAYDAAELFVDWVQRLNLRDYKRIMPLAHNWVFDRAFLIDWLGLQTFENSFDPRYRDVMSMSLYDNDVADWRGEEHPYPKNNLQYICSQLKVKRERIHTALDDCVHTAQAYKKMVSRRL
jgi:DNA polymerase III epsilon subunit-like protein